MYENLFKPLKVNSVVLRNRIISSPIDVHKSREKATGGASLIVIGAGFVSKEIRGRIAARNVNPFEVQNRDLALQLRETVNFWRQGGSLVSLEILHCGQYGSFLKSDYVYGPSAGVRQHDKAEIIALDEAKMAEIIEEFAVGARVAKEFGFDMVTAHFAHGWLISEFLSKSWNKRTDEYGGSYENRIRFPRRVLQAIRKAVGPDFPIDMRINAKDWVAGDLNDIDEVARFLEDMGKEGLVDMANISVGADMALLGNIRMAPHAIHPRMVNAQMTKYIKDRVSSIPITAVGSIMNPDEAEMLIKEGYCDAVWIGRPMVADPRWAKKACQDKAEDITPCLRCLYCFPMATQAKNVGCSVNARFNKEDLYPEEIKVKNPKDVVIIGAGPAGMKAAITAYDQGHKVTLVEKNDKIGGVIRFTDYVKSKQDLNSYMNYLITQVEKRNIKVHTNFDANYENIKKLNPQVLIVAVGATPITPPIKGANKPHVLGFLEVFPKLEQMGNNVVIIGGGTIGCEIAIDIAELGKNVTVVEIGGELNRTANRLYKIALAERMKELPTIKTMTNTQCMEIANDGVKVKNENGEITLKADNVIMATGLKPLTDLANSFFGITSETYVIGDCKKVGIVKNATEDAYFFVNGILD
ncbi:hypothetical protein AN644_00380 [Candidatus Epulonipiscium fishelsonii]|nr:hypothetical protein AN644_00380 [Epulopiscium sp. SCG-C06WGA-EpuloA1]